MPPAGPIGARLHRHSWPAGGSAAPETGAVAVIHGIGEHGGRYAGLGAAFATGGCSTHAVDLRGHGRSPGRRGHIGRWGDYLEDAAGFIRQVHQEVGVDLPLFLYGHSMGGLIVLNLLQGGGGSGSGAGPDPRAAPDLPPLAGAIVSGPPLRPAGVVDPVKVGVARLLSRWWPTFSLELPLPDEDLTRDPEAIAARVDDPLVHRRVTARWATEVLAAVDLANALPAEVRVPLLLLHGEADPTNDVTGTREFFARLPAGGDNTLITYPDARHELHHDVCRETVAADVLGWVRARSAGH